MASIKRHLRKDGTTSFYVLWRNEGTQTSKAFDDESEAKRFKAFLDANGNSLSLARQAARQAKGEGPSVKEAVEEHIAGLTGVSERTKDDYQRDARLHITPELGSIKVKQLTRRRVREWVNALEASGAAPKSISNWHGLLSAAMATAVEDKVRTDNPCRGVRLPKRDRKDDRTMFLEIPQYQLLLSRIPEHWRIHVMLLAETGLRWSEATALNVDDVVLDVKNPYVIVDKAWKRLPGNKYVIGEPKNENAFREVSISPTLAKLLAEHVKGRTGGDFLLRNASDSGHVTYRNFQGRVWAPAITAAMKRSSDNRRPLRHRPKIHHLRHSHASWLLADGVDIYAVSRRLGHESITTTTKIYGHLSYRSQQAAASAIDRALHSIESVEEAEERRRRREGDDGAGDAA